MSAGTTPTTPKQPVVIAASRNAPQNGLSLDDWLAEAVAQHLSDADATREFFRMRSAGARKDALREALDAIPDREPDPEDHS